jgi:Ankyrin repeats (3 copies)
VAKKVLPPDSQNAIVFLHNLTTHNPFSHKESNTAPMHLPITFTTMTTTTIAGKRPARLLGSSDDEKEAEVDTTMTRPTKAAKIATPLDVLMEAMSRRDNRQSIPMALHPHNVLIKMLEKKGVKTSSHNFQDVENFFCKPSQHDIDAYDVNLLNLVRAGDVEQLRCRLVATEGNNALHCSNKWGERLLHLACRKKQTAVVKFLIFEAKVPVRVVDDMGRTVLHDACWTAEPCFELVDILLNQCPDLLYIKDIRGHSPLFYARREHWCQWMRHLAAKADSLIPKILPIERIPIPPRRRAVATVSA